MLEVHTLTARSTLCLIQTQEMEEAAITASSVQHWCQKQTVVAVAALAYHYSSTCVAPLDLLITR